jgi:hypothetical protein
MQSLINLIFPHLILFGAMSSQRLIPLNSGLVQMWRRHQCVKQLQHWEEFCKASISNLSKHVVDSSYFV